MHANTRMWIAIADRAAEGDQLNFMHARRVGMPVQKAMQTSRANAAILSNSLQRDQRTFVIASKCTAKRSSCGEPCRSGVGSQVLVVSGGPASPRPLGHRPWTSLKAQPSLGLRYSGVKQPLRKATSKMQSQHLSATHCPRQLLL